VQTKKKKLVRLLWEEFEKEKAFGTGKGGLLKKGKGKSPRKIDLSKG